MKARVTCVSFLRIESVINLVLEVKSATDFLSPYIYNKRSPSSPMTQNLACENDLAWSIEIYSVALSTAILPLTYLMMIV